MQWQIFKQLVDSANISMQLAHITNSSDSCLAPLAAVVAWQKQKLSEQLCQLVVVHEHVNILLAEQVQRESGGDTATCSEFNSNGNANFGNNFPSTAGSMWQLETGGSPTNGGHLAGLGDVSKANGISNTEAVMAGHSEMSGNSRCPTDGQSGCFTSQGYGGSRVIVTPDPEAHVSDDADEKGRCEKKGAEANRAATNAAAKIKKKPNNSVCCSICETRETPQWRTFFNGKKNKCCNRCAMRIRRASKQGRVKGEDQDGENEIKVDGEGEGKDKQAEGEPHQQPQQEQQME
eukprot:GHVU01157948.1.p1 GENE.GHVU01157948.1~~GHVU01157948.1.p1  ORF type:complete len:291 (-),score=38.55 GHVU01157948.1:405-1277(-)